MSAFLLALALSTPAAERFVPPLIPPRMLLAQSPETVGTGYLRKSNISTCSRLAAIMTGETGTCGSLVLSASPTLTGLVGFGTAGITFADDGDGAVRICGNGNGFDECVTINLDDTQNAMVWSTDSGVNLIDFGDFELRTSLTGFVTVGAPALVADQGSIRLENTAQIAWEAAPAGSDITVATNSSNEVLCSNGCVGTAAPKTRVDAATSQGSPPYTFTGDTDTGISTSAADTLMFETGGTRRWSLTSSGHLLAVGDNNYDIGASSANRPNDIFLAGRMVTNNLEVKTVDSATTFAITSSYVDLQCTGAETINTITGGLTGTILYLQNTDTECTIADDDSPTASNAIDLTGSANDVGAVAKVLILIYNGSSWYELTESDN